MKAIPQTLTGFNPITIVIETGAEAISLWHRLNINSKVFTQRKNYVPFVRDERVALDIEEVNSRDMWLTFNSAYTPPNRP
jgi:hypothetical protein